MIKSYLLLVLFFYILTGCGEENTESKSEKIESPSISYDYVVSPSGSYSSAQIYVQKSVPVSPGTKVDIINEDFTPPRAIIQGVMVTYVKWKVPGPFRAPKYPASGFVTVSLSDNQGKAIKEAQLLSIRPGKDTR